MSSQRYLSLIFQSKDYAEKLHQAIQILRDLHIDALLREMADNDLEAREEDSSSEVNKLVIAAAKHHGYIRAVDNLFNLADLISTQQKRLKGKPTYGAVRDEISAASLVIPKDTNDGSK